MEPKYTYSASPPSRVSRDHRGLLDGGKETQGSGATKTREEAYYVDPLEGACPDARRGGGGDLMAFLDIRE